MGSATKAVPSYSLSIVGAIFSDLEDDLGRPLIAGLLHSTLVIGHRADLALNLVTVGIELFPGHVRFGGVVLGLKDFEFFQKISAALEQVEEFAHPVHHEIITVDSFDLQGKMLMDLYLFDVGHQVKEGKAGVGEEIALALAKNLNHQVRGTVQDAVSLLFFHSGAEQSVFLRNPLRPGVSTLLLPRPLRVAAAVGALHLPPLYPRLIRLAAKPVPNPLSIFTTVTPAAQELSMPKRAAMPWKLAP